MQVKRQREDFIVREISGFAVSKGNSTTAGRHAVYQLHKNGLGTPEAASEILSTWNVPRRDLSYGGLKDRHAVTTQMVTIFQGPQADLERAGFTLSYMGQAPREFTAKDIVANEFDITLRDLERSHAQRLLQALQTSDLALPNYFDDQRFGSVGESGQFVAHPWCLAKYEQALFLAIAEANRHDRSDDREQKELLRNHWGDWQACKDRLDRSHRRSIVTYLVDHPTGFKKAVALIRQDLRGIYVAAFQAKIWNEIVSRKLAQLVSPDNQLVLESVAGRWVIPKQFPQQDLELLRPVRIPLPSGRKTNWEAGILKIFEEVLGEFGIERHKLRFSHPRDVFFSRGERDLLIVPQDVTAELGDDEFASAGRKKLRITFRLLPGQYATMLVKGLELLGNAQQ